MLRLHDKLSPRLRFWLGFACCPLLTFINVVLLVLVLIFVGPYLSRFLGRLPGNWSYLPLAFFCLSGLVYLIAIPLFCGFSAAFFWCQLSCHQSRQSSAGFWSVALAWWPVLICVPVCPPIFLPILLFFSVYDVGMGWGVGFWNSNRPRQWLGDFSEMGASNVPNNEF